MPNAVIEAKLPIDNSLTNQLIYEGLIYIMSKTPFKITGPMRIEIYPDVLQAVYRDLEEERINSIELSMVGKNDTGPVQRFLSRLGIEETEKITKYKGLLDSLRRHSDRLPRIEDSLPIKLEIDEKKGFVSIGALRDKKDGVTLQLFKSERYTGITSTELILTAKQLGTYLSYEALIIGLLGVYSSFVTRVVEDRNIYYYFLFFDAGEASQILRGATDVGTLLLLKDEIRTEISKIVEKRYSEELLLSELMLNTSLQQLFVRHNIAGLSLILSRVAHEGQTYKLYQQVPLTVYQRRDNKAYQVLGEVLSPDGPVLRRLRDNRNPEHQNLVQVVNGAYRYLVLHDTFGLYLLVRELLNAADKLDESKKNEVRLRGQYIYLARLLRGVMTLA